MRTIFLLTTLLFNLSNMCSQELQKYPFKVEERFILSSLMEESEVLNEIIEKEKSQKKKEFISLEQSISNYMDEKNKILKTNFNYEITKAAGFFSYNVLNDSVLKNISIHSIEFNMNNTKFFIEASNSSSHFLYYNSEMHPIPMGMSHFQFWGDTIVGLIGNLYDTAYITKIDNSRIYGNFNIDTIFKISMPLISRTIYMFPKFGVCNNKWVYEDCGTVYVNGENLTKAKNYKLIKDYTCLNGKPFYFYLPKDSMKYRISCDNKDYGTLDYDKIFFINTYNCHFIINTNVISFYARRGSSYFAVKLF